MAIGDAPPSSLAGDGFALLPHFAGPAALAALRAAVPGAPRPCRGRRLRASSQHARAAGLERPGRGAAVGGPAPSRDGEARRRGAGPALDLGVRLAQGGTHPAAVASGLVVLGPSGQPPRTATPGGLARLPVRHRPGRRGPAGAAGIATAQRADPRAAAGGARRGGGAPRSGPPGARGPPRTAQRCRSGPATRCCSTTASCTAPTPTPARHVATRCCSRSRHPGGGFPATCAGT